MPVSLAGDVVKALKSSKISLIRGVGYLVEPIRNKRSKRKIKAKKGKAEDTEE